jgi:hypothetical protein
MATPVALSDPVSGLLSSLVPRLVLQETMKR